MFETPQQIQKEINLKPELNRFVMKLTYKGRSTFLRIFNDQMALRFDPSGAVTILAGTHSHGQSHETVNLGLGMRVFLRDWAAIQVDVRDNIFSLDLLGANKTTQNLELTGGLTFFF